MNVSLNKLRNDDVWAELGAPSVPEPPLSILGRCEASWGEPERDMTVSTRLSDSVFSETHGLENALKSEYE